ncbi:MAG: EscU/YscU/HrcU family type III secretion system export apparatus switch protein [Thermoguttaceae bacterium]|nr:EscU/YscU/HrcU family type III secretion system export apparatus switch protein [Thermoguttaceae bacterium]
MSEERKYEPTPKQRLEAQRRGQFAYSADVTAAAVFLFSLIALSASSVGIVTALKEQLVSSFTFQPSDLQTPDAHSLRLGCWAILGRWFSLTLPFWIMAIASSIIFHFAQRRFLFAPDREIASGRNVNPAEGLRKIFSGRNVWRSVMSVFKIAVIATIMYLFCKDNLESVVSLAQQPLPKGGETMSALIWGLLWRLAGTLLVLGIIDYFWQYWTFERSIRMTEQQMRDEMKNN